MLLGSFQRSSSHSYQGELYKYIKHLDLSSPRTRSSDRYLINRNFRFAHAKARSPHPYGSKISKVTHRCREVFPSIRPAIKTTHQNEFHAVRADRQIDRSLVKRLFTHSMNTNSSQALRPNYLHTGMCASNGSIRPSLLKMKSNQTRNAWYWSTSDVVQARSYSP